MHPPDPSPLLQPGSGDASPTSPTSAASALTRELARHGVTDVYTATTGRLAVISIMAGLTVWTNGYRLWCTHDGERDSWPVADTGTAATHLAALTRPAENSLFSRVRSATLALG